MPTATCALLAVTTAFAFLIVGGGLYEALVVDPFWPRRPGIVQPANGGVSRRRFWIPAHTAFEVLLVLTLVLTWAHPSVRWAVVVAVVAHAAMRVWSLADVVPKARAFERTDPATVDEREAVRWTRRSLLRIPLDIAAGAALMVALTLA